MHFPVIVPGRPLITTVWRSLLKVFEFIKERLWLRQDARIEPASPSEHATRSFFPFFNLDPELRSIVYKQMFCDLRLFPGDQSGECPSILLVNKQLHDEAKDALLKNARICIWWSEHLEAFGASEQPPFEDGRQFDERCKTFTPIGHMRWALGRIRQLEVRSKRLDFQEGRARYVDTKLRPGLESGWAQGRPLRWEDGFLSVFPELRSINIYDDEDSFDRDRDYGAIQVDAATGHIQPSSAYHPLGHLVLRIHMGDGSKRFFEGEVWKATAEAEGIILRWMLRLPLFVDVRNTQIAGRWTWKAPEPQWTRVKVVATMTFEECVLRFEVNGWKYEFLQVLR